MMEMDSYYRFCIVSCHTAFPTMPFPNIESRKRGDSWAMRYIHKCWNIIYQLWTHRNAAQSISTELEHMQPITGQLRSKKKDPLSISFHVVETNSILKQKHRRKNALIICLSICLGSILLGISIQKQKSFEKGINSFYLFQTTFQWNKKCLQVISHASLESFRDYSDDIVNWFE